MGFITNLAIRRQLKKHGYALERGFVPLSKLRRAVLLLDVEDAEFKECLRFASDWSAGNGIALKPFFLDLGKHGKDYVPQTDAKTTIFRRELAFCGTLPKRIVDELKSSPADLLISLASDSRPAVRCFCGIVPAKFCIGTCDYDGSPFNMVFSRPSDEGERREGFNDSLKCLESITEYLPKVI